jgi:hypothetical protein
MKLEKLFESDILCEGTRFTQREINAVKKKSRNIMVAFEFEFNAFADAMNKVSEGENPKDISEPEFQPREVWSLEDIWESDEYMQARDALWQEDYEEAVSEAKSEKESEYEQTFGEDYEDAMDALDTLYTTWKNKDGASDFKFISYLALNKQVERYKQMFDFRNQMDNPDILGYRRDEALKMLLDLKNLQKWLDETGYGDEIMGWDLNDMYELDQDRRPFYPPEAQTFINMLALPRMENFQSWIEMLMEVPFEDPQLVDIFKPMEAQKQQEFQFTEASTIDEKIAGIIDSLSISSGHNELTMLESFFISLEYYMKSGRNSNPYHAALEKYTEAMWEEEREEVEERVSDDLMNYWEEYDRIDFRDIIAEIQRNQPVIVMDDEDEPYVEPDDEDWSAASAGYKASPEGVKKFMIEYGHLWDLDFNKEFEKVVDLEGYGMVEFKSLKRPLLEAIDLMHRMLKFIRQIGTTNSGKAGMHTNISLVSDKFVEKNFNPTKLVALVDNTLLHELFPVRGHVDDLLANALTPRKVFAFANAPGRDLVHFFSNHMGTEKFQGMNWNHMKGSIDHLKRVEFRYTGGKDYAERGKVLEWSVYRFAYALEAAFDDQFLEKEYKRNILELLDDATKKYFKNQNIKSFDELRRLRMANPGVSDMDDFVEKWVRGEIMKRKS